ncbi:hypothetical protein OK348_09820 [Flavobacterium sp. MXW15]|uniref:Uncharacterized protein n=1 Tax=Xanthomonas chitinilytica TaxID=2989819 RepID=A0ABT3JW86_9XANT|nr:hypothetical protein [Xanthomonas sp. H13-6]MCW4455096.1 hypothetical protein [Flavobacterium sp. MXW15]MCW4472738.1 hypothetical protein [Xanthomonas sp. H13-6]
MPARRWILATLLAVAATCTATEPAPPAIDSEPALRRYLQAHAGQATPLDALPAGARVRFLDTLRFGPRGADVSIGDLHLLTREQGRALLALFGLQRLADGTPIGRVDDLPRPPIPPFVSVICICRSDVSRDGAFPIREAVATHVAPTNKPLESSSCTSSFIRSNAPAALLGQTIATGLVPDDELCVPERMPTVRLLLPAGGDHGWPAAPVLHQRRAGRRTGRHLRRGLQLPPLQAIATSTEVDALAAGPDSRSRVPR